MIDIKATLDRLLEQGHETEVLEFKEARSSYNFDKIGKYFSALANEANLRGQENGWLVFGVKDSDKSVVGTLYRKDKASLHGLKKEIGDKTTNRITFQEIHEVATPEGRVILFQIPPAPQGIPVAWDGHYYARDGESLVPLNLEKIERIRKQNQIEDWSIGICAEASLVDLSQYAIIKARELFLVKSPHLAGDIDGWDDVTFLNKAKLCIKGKVTRTAILLLGKPEAEHFLNPAVARISWILKDRDNIEKDYAHFGCPLLLTTEQVYAKIRYIKYRYMAQGTLFPEEVDSYDPYIVREALNNCIAHQDYALCGKINVVEKEDNVLIFSNLGSFIPESIESVITSDAPESHYRNNFLAQAMVSLNMIDTIGSGIKKMFAIQRRKFFPLPEYSFEKSQVKVEITGKVLDLNYAQKIAQMPELTLSDIMLLDKVQKKKTLSGSEIKRLKKKGLIEGRKPNFHISSKVAGKTEQEVDYMKMKGIDDDYYKEMILSYLRKFSTGRKSDFEAILLDKLPSVLDEQQKKDRIKNILQSLRMSGEIETEGRSWRMSKDDI